MTRQSLALTAATGIDWCCTSPHDIDRLIGHAVEAAGRQAAERATSGPSGGHADPTASGVMTGREPESVATMRSCALLIVDLARDIDRLARRVNPQAPAMGDARTLTGALRDATIPLHAHGPHLERIEPHGGEDIDWLLCQLADNAAWLHRKCAGIWAEHKGMPVAEQKPRLTCESCARYRIAADVERGHRCSKCRNFIDEYRVMPTEELCRWWDRNPSLQPTQLMRDRAKATGDRVKGRQTA